MQYFKKEEKVIKFEELSKLKEINGCYAIKQNLKNEVCAVDKNGRMLTDWIKIEK